MSKLPAALGNRGLTQPARQRRGPGRPNLTRQRWELLKIARTITTRKSMRTCGLYSVNGTVSIDQVGDRLAVTGTYRCDARLCPTCQPRLAAKQVATIGRAARHILENGGSAVMVTLTMGHARGDDLAAQLDALQAAWGAAMSGRARTQLRKAGLVHYVRALDYTHGDSGHHPHYHAILFFDRVLSSSEIEMVGGVETLKLPDTDAIELAFRTRWERSAKRSGRAVCFRGVQFSWVRDSEGVKRVIDYCGKNLGSAIMETVLSQSKTEGGRTIWDILLSAGRGQLDARLWREIEAATHKRRWMVYSRGFVELAELVPDLEDELEPDTVIEIGDSKWRALVQKGLVGPMLDDCYRRHEHPIRWRRWVVFLAGP